MIDRNAYIEAMNCEAVTNISGWTEPYGDSEPMDEEAYRERLARNAPAFHKLFEEVIESIRNPR